MERFAAIDNAVEVLNRLHKSDPSVMNNLVYRRVPCNDAVVDDPTIKVGMSDEGPVVGILGIINGLFGVDENNAGYIVANLDHKANIINFERKQID